MILFDNTISPSMIIAKSSFSLYSRSVLKVIFFFSFHIKTDGRGYKKIRLISSFLSKIEQIYANRSRVQLCSPSCGLTGSFLWNTFSNNLKTSTGSLREFLYLAINTFIIGADENPRPHHKPVAHLIPPTHDNLYVNILNSTDGGREEKTIYVIIYHARV